MNTNEQHTLWLEVLKEQEGVNYLVEELEAISDNPDEINDRFWKNLSFGTGGLRGEIGAGTNRMNIFTVSKATQGLANYLKKNGLNSTVIAYDTRNFSQEFALCAAAVLCANGINTYYFDTVHPTPMLSYAVRDLKASTGIVITASHNPKEYNGYKVYGPDGGQITDSMAHDIAAEIDNVDVFREVQTLEDVKNDSCFHIIGEEIDETYYEKVENLILRKELLSQEAKNFNILYTPLNGTGNIPVRTILSRLGFDKVDVVPEQENPDGNFTTTPYPNPEVKSVYDLAIKRAQETGPDIIFATDPDCDRIGVLEKNNGEYVLLTGNQVGSLLTDYICKTYIELEKMPPNPAIIKTIVTSDLGKSICKKYGVYLAETLTGFKYIGELAERWDENKEHSLLLGFEESYGYLSGNFVRDKDAVIAAALICEMALYYKGQESSLVNQLKNLYTEHGYYIDKLVSITKKGQQGQQEIASIISNVRENYAEILKNTDVVTYEDFFLQKRTHLDSGEAEMVNLPKSNVVKFVFKNRSWFVIRPSGTEPKIKIYYNATGENEQVATARLEELESIVAEITK